VSVYVIPTDLPEGDGTLEWNSTTMVVVELEAGGKQGIGFTYASAAAATLVDEFLLPEITGEDAFAINLCREKMTRAIRNQGRPGLASMAVSAVDVALWDLKAKLLEISLADLLGRVREKARVYGSGGFTTYSPEQLQEQVRGWVEQGITAVKIKVGGGLREALSRTELAREAIGQEAHLYTDANSAFTRNEALQFMEASAPCKVEWLEQPLPPEDLEGLRHLREKAPPRVRIAEGEYGYDLPWFRRLLDAGGADVVMPDATRCAGISGFLGVAAVAEAYRIPVSSHCAPLLHAHLGCAVAGMEHVELFHDHARIEEIFFEGNLRPQSGCLTPDPDRPGLGAELKRSAAEKYRRH